MSTTPDTSTTAGKIAVMQAAEAGATIEDRHPRGTERAPWVACESPSWNWGSRDYRIAAPAFQWPEGYTVHNPANVESAGGYRFLSTVEVLENGKDPCYKPHVDWWDRDRGRWDKGCVGASRHVTYRVPITHPFPVLPTPAPEAPKPAESTDVPAGMLPFDLEKALAGVEVVTRDGRLVTDLAHFPSLPGELKLAGVVSRELVVFLKTGKRSMGLDSSLDLFLLAPKPKTETRWVNFYGTSFYSSQEEADAIAKEHGQDRIACVEVTFTHGEGL